MFRGPVCNSWVNRSNLAITEAGRSAGRHRGLGLDRSGVLCHNSPRAQSAGRAGVAVALTWRARDALPPARRTSKGWEARMDKELSPLERVRPQPGLPPHRWTKVDDPEPRRSSPRTRR